VKRVYITFGGSAYDATTAKIVQDAPRLGADEVRVYDDRWLLSHPFYQLNRWIFDRKPKFGMGWCCWKPLIILEEMKRIDKGDLVLYTDADTFPIADLTPLFCLAQRDHIVLFEAQGCLHNRFTKRDCLLVMNADKPESRDTVMACGRFQLFQKGPWRVTQFLYEWLTYNLNPLCQFSDAVPVDVAACSWPSSMLHPEHSTYYRNSAEQSVLGLLALRYGIKLHREACQYGWPPQPNAGQPEDTYPQTFEQRYCAGDRTDVSGSRYRNV
jgi:hypothetical protein